MRAVTVQVDEKSLAFKTKEELIALFQQEVEEFSEWMAKLPGLQQGPLTQPEKVLLLTYLMQKHSGRLDEGK